VRTVFPAAACLLALTTAAATPRIFPTGVTLYDPGKAWNSFVIFAAPDQKTHLIDMDGNEVHRWDYFGFPSELLDPQVTHGALGHILVQNQAIDGSDTSVVPGQPAHFRNKTIAELDWSGRIVWQWGDQAPGGAARQHHDWYRLPNGNTLLLVNVEHSLPGFASKRVLDDAVYEVTPQGKITWQWVASDHLDEFGFTPQALELIRAHSKPDYLHLNNMTAVGPNRWFDGGNTRFDPDNILIDSREANFIAIIAKQTGKVVWRLGPDLPAAVDSQHSTPRPVDRLSGQHDAHLIPPGLPGAGNLLVFDNQGEAGYPPVPLSLNGGSRVLEIDPVAKQIIWEYGAEDSDRSAWTFFSSFISSARRLPNGNTLIDEGMNGRIFQVTRTGEVVWEYVNPYFAHSQAGGTHRSVLTNWVYRAQPVPYEWVPPGTPHAETAVDPPDITTFRVPARR
jgi:Arylsulfotransferase (ASST)